MKAVLFVAILSATILAALSLLHAYWAFGGRWAAGVALPTRNGERAFTPGPGLTLLVAVALLAAAALVVLRSGLATTSLPRGILTVGTWCLAGVLALRAIGDFRLVGFFQRTRDTRFARWDRVLFTPLCAGLAAACAWIAAT